MMDPAFLAMTLIVGSTLLLGAVYVPVWAVLHNYLTPRLDPKLFRKPYFHGSELVNYRVFPLSLLRSLNYIFLIGWPSLATRRRFRGFNDRVPVSWWITLLCRIQLGLMLTGLALAVAFFGWGGFMAMFVL